MASRDPLADYTPDWRKPRIPSRAALPIAGGEPEADPLADYSPDWQQKAGAATATAEPPAAPAPPPPAPPAAPRPGRIRSILAGQAPPPVATDATRVAPSQFGRKPEPVGLLGTALGEFYSGLLPFGGAEKGKKFVEESASPEALKTELTPGAPVRNFMRNGIIRQEPDTGPSITVADAAHDAGKAVREAVMLRLFGALGPTAEGVAAAAESGLANPLVRLLGAAVERGLVSKPVAEKAAGVAARGIAGGLSHAAEGTAYMAARAPLLEGRAPTGGELAGGAVLSGLLGGGARALGAEPLSISRELSAPADVARMTSDPFAVLGVSRDASPAEVAAAFRRRSAPFHPDVNPSPDATETFQAFSDAYREIKAQRTAQAEAAAAASEEAPASSQASSVAPTDEVQPAEDAGPGPLARVRRKVAETIAPELEEERRAAVRAAETDPLTGLANRAALDKALPAAEADPNTAVLVFDANNFGKINKTAGQEAGDQAIRDVGAAVHQAAHEVGLGERVFRRGGDEFVALVPKDKADAVRSRAEQLFGEKDFGDFKVSLSGTHGATFADADATLQERKAARKAPQAAAEANSQPTVIPEAGTPVEPIENPAAAAAGAAQEPREAATPTPGTPAPEIAAQEAAGAPAAPAAAPPPAPSYAGLTFADVLQLPPHELAESAEFEASRSKNIEAELFGEAGAKRYAAAQRTANSAMASPDRQRAADAVIDEMEGALTEAQRNRLFGIGETGYGPDELREIARTARESSPEMLADLDDAYLRNTVGRELLERDPDRNAVSALRLRGAWHELVRRGANPRAVLEAVAQRAVSQGIDPADASDLLRRKLERIRESGLDLVPDTPPGATAPTTPAALPPALPEASPALRQAFDDWNSGRAFLDNRGNYRVRDEAPTPTGPRGRSRIAPWNGEVKARFPDSLAFHRAAREAAEASATEPPAQPRGRLRPRSATGAVGRPAGEEPRFARNQPRASSEFVLHPDDGSAEIARLPRAFSQPAGLPDLPILMRANNDHAVVEFRKHMRNPAATVEDVARYARAVLTDPDVIAPARQPGRVLAFIRGVGGQKMKGNAAVVELEEQDGAWVVVTAHPFENSYLRKAEQDAYWTKEQGLLRAFNRGALSRGSGGRNATGSDRTGPFVTAAGQPEGQSGPAEADGLTGPQQSTASQKLSTADDQVNDEPHYAAAPAPPQPKDTARPEHGATPPAEPAPAESTLPSPEVQKELTKAAIREMGAELARRGDVVHARLAEHEARWEKVAGAAGAHNATRKATARARVVRFIDNIESGRGQADAADAAMAKLLRAEIEKRTKELRDMGALHAFIENYFPRIWKQPDEPTLGRILGRRPLEGSRSFLKKRTIPTFADGVAAGLEPVDWNPIHVATLKIREMDKFILARRMVDELKERGIIQYVRAFQANPTGHFNLDDRIFTVYGSSEVPVAEAYDEHMVAGLRDFAEGLGIKLERRTSLGRRDAWGVTVGEEVTTRFGGPETVLTHEIGHVLDKKFDLLRQLTDGSGRKSVQVLDQLRALANQRYAGLEADDSFKEYVRDRDELVANLVHAYVHAPELAAQVAPDAVAALRRVIRKTPELRPLDEIKPSLVIGSEESSVSAGGMVIRGRYTAPREVADVINKYLAPSQLQGKRWFQAMRAVSNVMNQLQLIGMFHAGFVSFDSAFSNVALAMERAVEGVRAAGRGEAAKAARQIGEAAKEVVVAPVSPIRQALRGHRVMREWEKPGSTTPELQEVVRAIVKGGGRAHMDAHFRTGAIAAFRRAVAQGGAGGILKATGLVVPAAAESAMKPLLEWVVPRMKLAAAADLIRFELERLGPAATPDDIRDAAWTAWRSVDNRLGQLVYDNLFWNRTAKDIAHLTVRSVGWNWGTINELGGGVLDLRNLVTKGKLSHRTAYLISMNVTLALLGAGITYLMTGRGPRELKDYFFPPTGRRRQDGSVDRISLPTYGKDEFAWTRHPLVTATHKVSPLLNLAWEAYHNEDFYGVQIVDPDAPWQTQAEEVAAYAGRSALPFSVRGFTQMKSSNEPLGRSALALVGVNPAPADITRSPFESFIAERYADSLPRGARSPEDVQRSRKVGRATFDLRSGKEPDLSDFTPRERSRILRSSRETLDEYRFARLPLPDQLRAWEMATPEEREENQLERHIFSPRLRERLANLDPDTREAVVTQLERIRDPGRFAKRRRRRLFGQEDAEASPTPR